MSKFTERIFVKIDNVFVLATITLFAAASLCLSLIGARQYGYVTDTMNANYEERTISSYLTEKIRQFDSQDTITIVDLNGTKALSLLTTENDANYITYIYCYDGVLRELLVTETSVFSLSSGQEIMKLHDFQPKFVNNSLIQATITDTEGNQQQLYFSLHCNRGKEEK